MKNKPYFPNFRIINAGKYKKYGSILICRAASKEWHESDQKTFFLLMTGYQIGKTERGHLPRYKGESKYNRKRTIKGIVYLMPIAFCHKLA